MILLKIKQSFLCFGLLRARGCIINFGSGQVVSIWYILIPFDHKINQKSTRKRANQDPASGNPRKNDSQSWHTRLHARGVLAHPGIRARRGLDDLTLQKYNRIRRRNWLVSLEWASDTILGVSGGFGPKSGWPKTPRSWCLVCQLHFGLPIWRQNHIWYDIFIFLFMSCVSCWKNKQKGANKKFAYTRFHCIGATARPLTTVPKGLMSTSAM